MVFVGSDGSYITGWQIWKQRNHEYERFVMADGEKVVFRDGDGGYVYYHEIDED